MDRKGIAEALIAKYGAVTVIKDYVKDAIDGISSMRTGIAENNQMLFAKDFEQVYEALLMAYTIISDKNNNAAIKDAVDTE